MNGKTSSETTPSSPDRFLIRVRRRLLGGRRNPFDPKVYQHISLIAFFAWVGMGADGISSANYGPEEAYLALKNATFLAPLLAIVIAATILIISGAYSQLIEQFPSGGGGYVVASKLLHPNAGIIAGSALLLDYVLTISVSIMSGVEALFSMFPQHWATLKIEVAILAIIVLVVMNLRGVKESVIVLLPIFLIFIITHVGLVGYGFLTHLGDLPSRATAGVAEARAVASQDVIWFFVVRFLQAFSMGAGTLTGIEAVSNGMLALKEPRIQTGKRTMAYMAASLSFLAAFILLNYFLFHIHHQPGKTLNAVLFTEMTGGWEWFGLPAGTAIVTIMLVSAALLLFVAAQTGFIGGPRVIANMAEDSWLPHRFGHLSERLVTQNGILFMGLGAIAFILYARGHMSVLVSMYAINVFIGFALALLGMSRLWWSRRATLVTWWRKLAVSGVGFLVSVMLLAIMIAIKFVRGGWLVLLVTFALVALCFYIRRHYQTVQAKVEKIDEILTAMSFGDVPVTKQPLSPNEPTAVILVEKYSGTGIHLMLNVMRLFGPRFKQFMFVSVGAIDTGHFKGVDELAALQERVKKEADKYVLMARSYGLKADSRTSLAIDYVQEIERVCLDVHHDFPNSVFFAARLLFWKDTFWSRLLHNETPLTLQRRLLFHGLQFVVLPVRLQ